MDKLTIISGTFFLIADIFAIISLAMPDWIITDIGGDTRLGLMWTCMTIYNRPQVCYTPDLQPEWLLALVCIFIGCICITTTIILLISSHWDRNVIPYARWVGFTAMVLFCLAAVIFPMGFHIDEIGGQPYQLPNSHQVGISYILFVLSLWVTVMSELFAGRYLPIASWYYWDVTLYRFCDYTEAHHHHQPDRLPFVTCCYCIIMYLLYGFLVVFGTIIKPPDSQ